MQQPCSRSESFPAHPWTQLLSFVFHTLGWYRATGSRFPTAVPLLPVLLVSSKGAQMCWEAPLPRVLPGDLRMVRVEETVSLCCFVYKNIFAVIDVRAGEVCLQVRL